MTIVRGIVNAEGSLKEVKMKAKEAHELFKKHAFKRGYTFPIVGDFAFAKNRDPHSPYIKLWGAKDGKLQVFETDVGRYEINIGQQKEKEKQDGETGL